MLLVLLIIVINLSYCRAGLRIIGGRDALKDEFPFVVALEQKIPPRKTSHRKKAFIWHFCTGAALTPVWILSAAHCGSLFENENKKSKHVSHLVRYNSYKPKYKGDVSLINDVMLNPAYDKGTLRNDICLFLAQEIKVAYYGKVSAVDYTTLVGHEAFAVGYGATNTSISKKPLQVLKGMLNHCLDDEPATFMLCLVPPCGIKATICGGDSGGAVIHHSGIVGVNSMSADNCYEDTEQLYITPGTSASIIAMVSPLIDWITNTITNKTSY